MLSVARSSDNDLLSILIDNAPLAQGARGLLAASWGLPMFAYVRFHCRLYQLERQLRRSDRKFKSALAEAKTRKAPAEEIDALRAYFDNDYWETRQEIKMAHSQYLLRKASRLLLPAPDLNNEMWETDRCLSERGINHMRKLIREERKARVELFLLWVPGVVGILGTLVALASILLGKK